MIKRNLCFIVATLPFVIGVVLSVLLSSNILPNYVFVGNYDVDLAWILSRICFGISLLAVAGLVVSMRIRQPVIQNLDQLADRSSRDQRKFLQRLDHELKNPITILRLSVVNLQHSPNLTEVQKASLARIEQQTERLQKLMIDLRWLSEVEECDIERTLVDPCDVLQQAIEDRSPVWRDRDIKLRIQEMPGGISHVMGDRDLLVAAMRNLVDNALKFTERHGQIELRATDDGHLVTLEVADTGIGIPDTEMPYIFDELYRGFQAKQVPGSGLGLTLVKRIITLHEGTLQVRSRAGHGTVVTIQLPLVPRL